VVQHAGDEEGLVTDHRVGNNSGNKSGSGSSVSSMAANTETVLRNLFTVLDFMLAHDERYLSDYKLVISKQVRVQLTPKHDVV
jgi:hypothetical protein